MKLSVNHFTKFHFAVHGKEPFAWQSRLLAQIVADRAWPGVLDLPTGSGKTTCVDVAVFALALDAQKRPMDRWCPRRIAMVVDRRIVVDQVSERGRAILRALLAPDQSPVVAEVARLLQTLTGGEEEPLGVFTLRGGIPKDDGWARTPHQPLVLASTVDQLGSRMLVQGYGVSQGMKPVQAGLLGNDTLLLLDEVHLSQPFAQTLEALAALRTRFATNGLPSRFQHVFLSATPLAGAKRPFRLDKDEKAAASPLGARLHAHKHARLVQVEDRTALEGRCIDEARELLGRHDVVAVVVNRVATATTIADELGRVANGAWDTALLTGRMRPLDRDDILEALRPRIMTGRDRGCVARKLVLVGTQCLEAGADFDFDALVTECASLDALRQRFGRVDRLGLYQDRAEGVIVQDKGAKDDPIYGEALTATARWLKGQLATKRKVVDFGIMALAIPPDDVLGELVAPKPAAPALLPAYLDLWVQTASAPVAVPDASLWLHGPRSGPADVQVVWRADLTESDLEVARAGDADEAASARPAAIVASVRPSSLEAIALPFAAAHRWLSGLGAGDIADVELPAAATEEEGGARGLAVRWNGDRTEVIMAKDLHPGDTIVVPASRGGIRNGCFAPAVKGTAPSEVTDLAERAALVGRGQAVLRLHPAVLRQLGLGQVPLDIEDARTALGELADAARDRGWRTPWLHAVARARLSFVVDGEEPWSVLRGRRLSAAELRRHLRTDDTIEDGVELTTDDESSHAGRSVELSIHSTDVEDRARRYATELGFARIIAEDIALAAWLHDVGKADRRFQILLRGGSEIAYFKRETPLAKSAIPAGANAAQRIAARKSGYPEGGRHEVQSVAMLERHLDAIGARAHDLDLVVHLVASHHGHCRPLAPVVADDRPVDVVLPGHRSTTFGLIDFGPTTSNHGLQRLDSPLAARFWRLVARYGWLELCWLEATLRLADHRASEQEQETGGST